MISRKPIVFLILAISAYQVCGDEISSLAFVIDNTESMLGFIEQMKAEASRIIEVLLKSNSEIKDFVLVTFNNYDSIDRKHRYRYRAVEIKTVTKNRSQFEKALSEIKVHGGNLSCAVCSMFGIVEAIKSSQPRSSIYVFTDASALDYFRYDEVKSLAVEKQSKVTFFLSGVCKNEPKGRNNMVYEQLAAATSGTVFNVTKDDLKHLEIIMSAKPVVHITVNNSNNARPTISHHQTEIMFQHGFATSIVLSIKDTTATPLPDVKSHIFIKLIGGNIFPETVNIIEYESSNVKEIPLIILEKEIEKLYATELTELPTRVFEMTISGLDPNTGKIITSKHKHKIEPQHRVNDVIAQKAPVVVIKQGSIKSVAYGSSALLTCNILALQLRKFGWRNSTGHELNSKNITRNNEITIELNLQNVKVNNTYSCFAENIQGTTVKNIELSVMSPASKPVHTTITEGSTVDIDYDGEISLTCQVSGYPAPEIIWTSKDSTILSRKSYVVESPYNYVSYLKLKNVKHTETYYCRATNTENGHESMINVKPRSPFRISSSLTEPTQVKYGEEKQLICSISSSYPFYITWSTPLKFEDFTLSADKKVLTIKQVSIAAQGRYTCEATLKADPEQKASTAIDVQINNLAIPRLATPGNITILHGEKIYIRCKITGGVPLPSISWQFRMNDDTVFRDMHITGEEMTINNASLVNAGQYQCVATNDLGKAQNIIKVVVQRVPEVVIQEGSKITVAYGSSTTLTCKIYAFPLPRIGWKDSRGYELASKNIINNKEIKSVINLQNVKVNGTYSCFADNILGKVTSHIDLSVNSPFVVLSHPGETTVSKYGAKTDITCEIKSAFPYKIRWYKSVGSAISEIHTSNKYTISSTGTILHIQETDFITIGKYTCEAILDEDRNENIKFTTVVQINDLSPPVLQDTEPTNITVQNKHFFKIICKIASGSPPPAVTWQIMRAGDTKFKDLQDLGQELNVNSATLADAGRYRCIANNTEGHDEKTIEVFVQKAPEVSIDKGATVTVPYGTTVYLKCKTDAYPPPHIVWRDSEGHELRSEKINNNYEVISTFTVKNTKTSKRRYFCNAYNVLNESEASVQVTVLSPITLSTDLPEIIRVKYGAQTKILCDAKSLYPIKIKWFYQKNGESKKSEIQSGIYKSDKYTISSTGTMLYIQPTDLNTIGKYTCEAALVNDKNENTTFTTDVQLSDLSPPVLQDTVAKAITVRNKNIVNITCKIASGTPPPVVSWQVMKTGDKKFRALQDLGQELNVNITTLADAGQYKCLAKNTEGYAEKTIEVSVVQAPEVSIDKGPTVTVPYGSTVDLKCRTVAYPPPEILWTDSKGLEQTSEVISNNYEVISRLRVQTAKASNTKYFCNAANVLGKSEAGVQVTVLSPFTHVIKPPEKISVSYKAPTSIHCNAKSWYPIQINWYFQKNGLSKKSEIHTSDKYMISRNESWLRIIHTDLDLVGKYTCKVSLVSDRNENKSFTTNVEINNLQTPKIIYTNNTVTVMDGHELFITCKSTGIPEPVVTWRVKTKNSDTFDTKRLLGQNYINSQISYAWAGLYECTAANEIGSQNRTIEVIVHGKPYITNTDSVYIGITGDMVLRIPCEITGVPEPVITWKHGNKVVTSGTKLSVIKNSIVIKNPTENDSSNFTCEAKNAYGYATKYFEAIISEHLIRDDKNEDLNSNIYLKPGESKDIKCLLHHSDPQSIRWYVNDEKTNVLGTNYSIRNAKFENDGNYSCRLNTDQGSESLNYVVDVGYKPSFKMVLDYFYVWNGNKKDTLDCDVHAKPDAVEAEWFYNGKRLDYDGVGLPISGWGIYSCNISNKHGSIQHTYNVTSDGCMIDRTATGIQNTPLLIGDEPSSWPQFDTVLEFFTVSQNEIITLECATLDQPQNTFKTFPNANTIDAECLNEDKFIVDEKIYKFEDLQCKEYVKPSQVFTKKTCLNNGEAIKIGFKLHSGFLEVYEVCYNYADHRTLFVKVVISKVNVGNKVESSFELNEGINTGRKYGEIIKCQYNQRWLVNPVDVTFGPAQMAALLDEYNAVLVYEPCDSTSRKSWSDIENAVQNLFKKSDTLPTWTGASNYNSQGIPRYLWKVVKVMDNIFESIVYVNAPNADVDYLCTPNGFKGIIETSDQYSYSCTIGEFMKAFNLSESDLI